MTQHHVGRLFGGRRRNERRRKEFEGRLLAHTRQHRALALVEFVKRVFYLDKRKGVWRSRRPIVPDAAMRQAIAEVATMHEWDPTVANQLLGVDTPGREGARDG